MKTLLLKVTAPLCRASHFIRACYCRPRVPTRRLLRHASTFARACYGDTLPATRHSLAASAIFLACIGLVSLSPSCATTPQGISREQVLYRVSTNAVGTITQILPFVPAPVATPVEILLGVASAALGAWNLHQQKTLRTLKNGFAANGKNGPGNGGPAPLTAPAGCNAAPANRWNQLSLEPTPRPVCNCRTPKRPARNRNSTANGL